MGRNTVGKGEIARSEQFLPSVFKRLVLQPCKNQGLFGKGLKGFQETISNLIKMTKFFKWVENTVGKEEIDHYEQFLLFLQYTQKICTQPTRKNRLVWERVKMSVSPCNLDMFRFYQ